MKCHDMPWNAMNIRFLTWTVHVETVDQGRNDKWWNTTSLTITLTQLLINDATSVFWMCTFLTKRYVWQQKHGTINTLREVKRHRHEQKFVAKAGHDETGRKENRWQETTRKHVILCQPRCLLKTLASMDRCEEVLCIGTDCDLALLDVPYEEFWKAHLGFSGVPLIHGVRSQFDGCHVTFLVYRSVLRCTKYTCIKYTTICSYYLAFEILFVPCFH